MSVVKVMRVDFEHEKLTFSLCCALFVLSLARGDLRGAA